VFGKWEDAIAKKLAGEQKYLIRKREKDSHGDSSWYYTIGPRMEVEGDLHTREAFVSELYNREVDPEKIRELETERMSKEEREKLDKQKNDANEGEGGESVGRRRRRNAKFD
jgi:hypothetical protein